MGLRCPVRRGCGCDVADGGESTIEVAVTSACDVVGVGVEVEVVMDIGMGMGGGATEGNGTGVNAGLR